jgi:predicted nuclease of predicted toxin-antitoxin system
MAERYLADENFPGAGVRLLRTAGHDVRYVAEIRPGADDVAVAEEAVRQDAVLLTFDLDFGELTVKRQIAVPGVVLFRLRQQPPNVVLPFLEGFFAAAPVLRGFFTVASPGQMRQRPLLHVVDDTE